MLGPSPTLVSVPVTIDAALSPPTLVLPQRLQFCYCATSVMRALKICSIASEAQQDHIKCVAELWRLHFCKRSKQRLISVPPHHIWCTEHVMCSPLQQHDSATGNQPLLRLLPGESMTMQVSESEKVAFDGCCRFQLLLSCQLLVVTAGCYILDQSRWRGAYPQ